MSWAKVGGFFKTVLGIAAKVQPLLQVAEGPFGPIITRFMQIAVGIEQAIPTKLPGETKGQFWIDFANNEEQVVLDALKALAKPGSKIDQNSAEYADVFAKGRDFAVAILKATGHFEAAAPAPAAK